MDHAGALAPRRTVRVLAATSIGEVAIGLFLIVLPAFVFRLLFGSTPGAATNVAARVAGMALVALGVACCPTRGEASPGAVLGMLIYSLAVTVFFAWLGFAHAWVGPLLWPATLLHAAVTVLLAGGLSHRPRRSAHRLDPR